MAPAQAMSNPVLAGRIQGFGNVNPPPLEEENAKSVAKRVAGNLGSMLGEEVALTVDDFRQKGAVGAVKDAVADAGDLLIDGVAGVFGWLRGDPPAEEEEDPEKSDKAQSALAQGPAGAAYGISQASPTGGINAVWVMPEEADPATLAQLATQARPGQNPMQVPGGPAIQPYMPQSMQVPGGPVIQPYQPNAPMHIPGGPAIQPYVPSGPGQRAPPFAPSQAPNFQQFPGAPSSTSTVSGTRGLVEQVAKGETIVGPTVAKRLLSQSASAKLTGKQLGEVICERARRLYLGLDSCADSDAAIMRILSLVDAIAQQEGPLARGTAQVVAAGVSEELLSLRSSRQHSGAAEPMLRRIGLVAKAPEVDLLGGDEAPKAAPAAGQMDLLGGMEPSPAAAPAGAALIPDLL